MRQIKTFNDQELAERFSIFLKKEGISNSAEGLSIWVLEEDQVDKALGYLDRFEKNPTDFFFNVDLKKEIVKEAIEEPLDQVSEKKGKVFKITFIFIALCCLIYFLTTMQILQLETQKKEQVTFSPLQLALLYDVPLKVDLLKDFLEKRGLDLNAQITSLSSIDQQRAQQIADLPEWKGIYPLLLPKKTQEKTLGTYPPFRKILQGQVYRLFTPCLMHGGLLHILFNMIWLWVLGKQIEMRLSSFRYVLLIVLIGIISNTAQYLVNGPYFLGFSGVVLGLAGFIWSRQRVAPWEGHLVHPSTFIFLGFFVLSMVFLQLVSYFIQLFGSEGFPGFIANTAHIVGALFGILLGRLSFFSWRPREQ